MHFYWIPELKLSVMWSPKCACTSVVEYVSHYNFHNCSEYSEQKRRLLADTGFNLNINNLKDLINKGECQHLAVSTRDPIKRITSAFLNKFLYRYGKPVYPNAIAAATPWPAEFVKQCAVHTYSDIPPAICQSGNIDICLARVITFLSSNSTNLAKVNSHFRPQIINKNQLNFIKEISKKVSTYWIRTEKFSSDLEFLNNQLSVPAYVPDRANESSLPKGWTTSEKAEDTYKQISELTKMKLSITSKSTEQLIESNNLPFKEKWDFDYKLLSFLKKNAIYSDL